MVFSIVTSLVSSFLTTYTTIVVALGGYTTVKKAFVDSGIRPWEDKKQREEFLHIAIIEFTDAAKFPSTLYRHHIIPKTAPLVVAEKPKEE